MDNHFPPQESIVSSSGQVYGGGKVRINDDTEAIPQVVPHPNHPEVSPAIFYMVIPGGARENSSPVLGKQVIIKLILGRDRGQSPQIQVLISADFAVIVHGALDLAPAPSGY